MYDRRIQIAVLLWITKVDVPAGGVASAVTEEDMKKNLDPKGKKRNQ